MHLPNKTKTLCVRVVFCARAVPSGLAPLISIAFFRGRRKKSVRPPPRITRYGSTLLPSEEGGITQMQYFLTNFSERRVCELRIQATPTSACSALCNPFTLSTVPTARYRPRSTKRGNQAWVFCQLRGFVSLNSVEDHSFSKVSISSLERDSPNLVEPLQASALARSSPPASA